MSSFQERFYDQKFLALVLEFEVKAIRDITEQVKRRRVSREDKNPMAKRQTVDLEPVRKHLRVKPRNAVWRHRLGIILQKMRREHPKMSLAELSRRTGERRDILYRAMQFVTYLPREADIRGYEWSKLKLILSRKDDAEALLPLARDLSLQELQTELEKEYPRSRQRGRLRPGNPEDDLLKLFKATKKWLAVAQQLWPRGPKQRIIERFPNVTPVFTHMDRAERSMMKLVEEYMKSHRENHTPDGAS